MNTLRHNQLDGDHQERIETAYRALRACRSDSTSRRRDDLDQCPATNKTTIRRLSLLLGLNELEERQVLLLGDDDLLSIAIAAAGLSTRVTVIDLDHSLLERIERWTKTDAVQLVNADLRSGLPTGLAGNFDLVFTDPPYTPAGQLLFLGRGLSALRRARSSSLFLCASRFYLGAERIKMILRAAESAGLHLVGSHENFNEYKAPPDVAEDIRLRDTSANPLLFHSSLFYLKPRCDFLSLNSFPFLDEDIYNYEKEQVSS